MKSFFSDGDFQAVYAHFFISLCVFPYLYHLLSKAYSVTMCIECAFKAIFSYYRIKIVVSLKFTFTCSAYVFPGVYLCNVSLLILLNSNEEEEGISCIQIKYFSHSLFKYKLCKHKAVFMFIIENFVYILSL